MDAKHEIQRIKEFLTRSDFFRPGRTTGCSEERVQKLDRYAACGRLPELYREFLLAMGKSVEGRFMVSYCFLCKELVGIQEGGRKLAKESRPEIPPDAYFFASDGESIYLYFRTNEPNDNPPVYMCSRRRPPFMLHQSFRGFLGAQFGEEQNYE